MSSERLDEAVGGENIEDDSTLEQSMISSPGEGKDDLTSGTIADNIAERVQQMELATSQISDWESVSNDKGARKKTLFWRSSSEEFPEHEEQGSTTVVNIGQSTLEKAQISGLTNISESNISAIQALGGTSMKVEDSVVDQITLKGGISEFSGANIGTLNIIYSDVGKDNPLAAQNKTEQKNENKGEKKDVLVLGGITVFLNKIIYQDADGGVTIYEGEKSKLGGEHNVAVKFLPNRKNAEREAESLEEIRHHPNVVGIFGTGINRTSPMNGYIYIAMERCSKMTLYDYVNESHRFDQQQALKHSLQIISGLEYIHKKRIAHRDLKPQNILFHKDNFDQIKISDFGLSKSYLIDPSVTTGGKIGTKGYSAPELVLRETPDDPLMCDIFSLGIVVFFILSNGKHPYGTHDWQWESNIARNMAPNLSDIILSYGKQRDLITRIIQKMLQYDQRNRPSASSLRLQWETEVGDSTEENSSESGKMQIMSLSESLKKKLAQGERGLINLSHIEANIAHVPNIKGTSRAANQKSGSRQVESDTTAASYMRPRENPLAEFTREISVKSRRLETRSPTLEAMKLRKIPEDTDEESSLISPVQTELQTKDFGDCKILKGGEYALEINPIKPGTHVYRGVHRMGPTNQPIIGKMIHSPEEHENEIAILVTLQSHENVMRVVDSAKDESHYNYIILEECKADTLHDIMKRGQQLNFSEMWLYTKQLVEGMRFIHANSVIHWDLKPENIFFSHTGQLKIGDFGLSKQLNFGRSKKTNIDAGTDGWRAPETYSANKIDKKSDIFSLGLVFYFIWANGKHPFGTDIHDWCYNIKKDLNCDLTLLLLPDGTKRNDLLSLLKRMLDSDRANRPTMEDIAQDSFFQEELVDPIVETIKEIDENLSAPLSTAEYIGSEECEISIMGCKLLFAKMPSEETPLVYVAVRPISDDVPNGKFAISPEVECEIFKSSCQRLVTICLPLQALPDDKGLSVLGKVDTNSGWGDLSGKCEDPDKTQEDRYVKLQIPIQKSIKILVTCSEIQTPFTKNFLYSKNQQQCRIMCLDSESLITRLHDIFKRGNFNKIPITGRLQAGERLIYPYKYKFTIWSLPSEKQIIIQEDEFVKVYYKLVQPLKTRVTDGVQTSTSPQEQNGTKGPTKDRQGVPSVKLVCAKRSAKSFFEKKNKSSSNENYFVYPDRPKGVVLIINNETKNKKYRKGSREDMKLQLALWKDLGFDVIPEIDLNAEDMEKACKDLATKANKNRVSIVVVVIMSHGKVENEKEAFAGEDGELVYLDDVVSPFIKSLKGIPKLFVFQACRVKLRDERCASQTLERIYRYAFSEPPDNEADAITGISGAAGEEDMLFAYPCRVGESAYRSKKSGSHMMQAVAQVFMQNAHNTDVLAMLTMVNGAISKMDREQTIQRSCQNSLMRKKLYLFPGWPV